MDRTIEDFVRGLALDAYLVGGAVRDELLGLESKDADFVVPGVDYEIRGIRCRDYTHSIYIDGRPQTARTTACRNPDATWSPVS